jgi:hypothetical protein
LLKNEKEMVFTNNVTNIESITNKLSYITISTYDNTPVKFKNIEIANNTRIKFSSDNANSRMLVYSGVRMHGEYTRHKVNYIIFSKIDGKVKYDYDQSYRTNMPTGNII